LPLLEAAAVGLLKELEDNEWSTRQMRHASYCAQGLVHFGHVPKELLSILTPRALEHWDWRAACCLAWALTISNELDSPLVPILFKGIAENAEDALENGFPRQAALSKIWQLVSSLNQMRHGSLSRKTWSEHTRKVIDLAQSHWEALVHEETKITSGVQKEVHRSMLSMGYTADLECAVCGLSIDVAVQEIKLAVEVDGFAHFARNKPNQAVGNSLWKKRLLEANGWVAVNVNVKDWCNKRGAGEKRELLKEAIAKEEEKKRLKDAARLKKKNYWKASFPRARAKRAAAKRKALQAVAV
jgi:very-short-patch-repair endonuclease